MGSWWAFDNTYHASTHVGLLNLLSSDAFSEVNMVQNAFVAGAYAPQTSAKGDERGRKRRGREEGKGGEGGTDRCGSGFSSLIRQCSCCNCMWRDCDSTGVRLAWDRATSERASQGSRMKVARRSHDGRKIVARRLNRSRVARSCNHCVYAIGRVRLFVCVKRMVHKIVDGIGIRLFDSL